MYLYIKQTIHTYFWTFFILHKSNSMAACVSLRISLTAEPKWLYFTVMLIIGSGKVFNHFGVGYHKSPRKSLEETNPPSKFFYIKYKIENGKLFFGGAISFWRLLENPHIKSVPRGL